MEVGAYFADSMNRVKVLVKSNIPMVGEVSPHLHYGEIGPPFSPCFHHGKGTKKLGNPTCGGTKTRMYIRIISTIFDNKFLFSTEYFMFLVPSLVEYLSLWK